VLSSPYPYGLPPYHDWFWAGSTVQGDLLRGLGAYGIGAGYYNRETAIANDIQTRTALQYQQWVHAAHLEQMRRYGWSKASRAANVNTYCKLKGDRLRNHPLARDVWMGNALNQVLDDLAPLGKYLYDSVECSRSVETTLVRRIPLHYAAGGLTVSLEHLLANRVPAGFEAGVIRRDPRRFKGFLDKLERSEEITLGELLAFLHDFGLRFGVAESPEARRGYATLHGRLDSLRKQVKPEPTLPVEKPAKS
jgi:hypothetical protein